jgi:hypothetical protein
MIRNVYGGGIGRDPRFGPLLQAIAQFEPAKRGHAMQFLRQAVKDLEEREREWRANGGGRPVSIRVRRPRQAKVAAPDAPEDVPAPRASKVVTAKKAAKKSGKLKRASRPKSAASKRKRQ